MTNLTAKCFVRRAGFIYRRSKIRKLVIFKEILLLLLLGQVILIASRRVYVCVHTHTHSHTSLDLYLR